MSEPPDQKYREPQDVAQLRRIADALEVIAAFLKARDPHAGFNQMYEGFFGKK